VAFARVLAMSEKCVPSRERATRKPASLPLLSRQLSRICVEEIGVALRLLGAISALLSAVEEQSIIAAYKVSRFIELQLSGPELLNPEQSSKHLGI
jgi:hypothetical protein